MGRPRKNQAKPPSKSPPKFVAVRKSSRQIARKQQKQDDGGKVNGEIVQTLPNNCANDFVDNKDETNKSSTKPVLTEPRKRGRPRTVNREKVAPKIVEERENVVTYKKDVSESDSQEATESAMPPKKLTAEDVRQMVVGLGDSNESSMNETESSEVLWSEDVIEETIICEEMEVEGEELGGSHYTLADDGSVVLEEVLLVNEPDYDGKNVVKFTLIHNEDGTDSMVESMVVATELDVSSMNNHYEETSEYEIIEEGVSSLRVDETPSDPSPALVENKVNEKLADDSESDGNARERDSQSGGENRDKVLARKKSGFVRKDNSSGAQPVEIVVKGSRDESSLKEDSGSSVERSGENGSCSRESPGVIEESSSSSDVEKAAQRASPKEDALLAKIDNELQIMMIDEKIAERDVAVEPADIEDTSSVPESPALRTEATMAVTSIQDDEDSAQTSDKSEQSRSEDNGAAKESPKSDSNGKSPPTEEQLSPAKDRKDSPKPEPGRGKGNRSNPISTRSAPGNAPQSKSHADRPQNIEELSRDSEMDGKADSEDTKLSSSSENSNDTSLSLNSCKLPDFNESKAATPSSLNEAEKKVGFRSRSGSTDTTGSESGSNSSAVRRSSRIRSIGLMKQRSRGRGLVTKPNLDLSKVVLQQERDRVASSAATTIQDLRDTLDSQSETQSDREGSNKTATSADPLAPSTPTSGVTGYDSDSSKPVKVKSRWRRSSELEMGGSASGSRLGFGSLGSVAGTGSGPGSATGSDFGSGPSCPGSGSSSAAVTPVPSDFDLMKEPGAVPIAAMSPVAKAVGARISLPMVLEVKDREMEERLSQFEHLSENAYLTERYTNKETKRMVCDCFLTEEEIERGELGCGEDCLNRLLMIECGSRCVVNDRCTNKRFQNCEYAKCEVFRTEKKGFGLRATQDLLAGEFIMEYVGEVLDAKDFRRRAKDYSKDKNRHYYFMALKSDQIIDATMKGNISRFINHSCDPNAETQKWTVNGELRIGFFNRRFIAAGEEITFDYHFQRYGKEAQKCFCEATNCRGWIGDTPEEEKEKIEKKEKREKDDSRKKKKEQKKPVGYMEDEDLEEEIDKLCQCGLKNRAHTLNLSRLMVRSRELEHRTRLLKLIQSGEQPCRRLFLDYHGLRLIWSYMMDIAGNEAEEAQQFRLEVLRTLSTLPIPNKTMLMDSKVYSVVQKWSEERYLSPRRESPEDEQTSKTAVMKAEEIDSNCDSNEKPNIEQTAEAAAAGGEKDAADGNRSDDVKVEPSDQALIPELSANLLNEWANLKEVFRIPKKERIEQMKEHEREADRGYREDLEKENRRETWYERSRTDRYGRADSDKRIDRRRGRESPDSESYRSKDKRSDERTNLVPVPRLSKFERRQLFAMQVAKEEEERLRRQQQESWQEHEARCLALGIDPHTTATVDPQTGYPLFFNPALGQWQPYPMQDGEIAAQCTPMYPSTMPPGHPAEMSPAISQTVYAAGFPQPVVAYPGLTHHHQQYPDRSLVQVHNGTPPIAIPGPQLYIDKPLDPQFATAETAEPIEEQPEPQPDVPPIDLPPKWKCAKDARGRLYYYHVKERISQWLPPPPDHIGVQPDSSSSSESSDESSSSNEEEDDQDEDRGNEAVGEDMDCAVANSLDNAPGNAKHAAANKLDSRGIVDGGPTVVVPEPKKRRDGLVQERIISPRREEDRIDHKKYKDVKEKMRRQKERARLKEHVDKLRKHRRANKSKSHSRHSANKVLDATNDITAADERKIKDTFRINMANVMVHFLNPYRKNDCKQGRITNTEDFKHLARKLTHFVLVKELKHCKTVDELQCNDNVKHKAKDFVRKYMNKFGEVYHKSDEEKID